MVKQGIVLGHIISSTCIEIDKVTVDLISNLPPPKIVKEVRSFLRHAGFIDVSLKILAKFIDSYAIFLLRIYLLSLMIHVSHHLKS